MRFGRDARIEDRRAVRDDTHNGADSVLVAAEIRGDGIVTGCRSGEDEIGVLPADSRNEHDLVGQEVDVAVVVGGPVVLFDGRGAAVIDRRRKPELSVGPVPGALVGLIEHGDGPGGTGRVAVRPDAAGIGLGGEAGFKGGRGIEGVG